MPLVPGELPDLAGVLIFVSGGRCDTVIPPQQTERLAQMLQLAGANVTLHWEPGGHALTPAEVQAAATWLQRVQGAV